MQKSREQITFSYDPRTSEPWVIDFMRRLEGFLQRMETRIETLQDQMDDVQTRLTALETP
jgi:hypothetical protein